MTFASARKAVETTLDTIRKRTPAYGDIADKFGPVFMAVAELRDDFLEQDITAPEVDASRLAAGVPVMVGTDLVPWKECFAASAKKVLPILVEVLELDEDASEYLIEKFSNTNTVMGLAQARIEGDWKPFENLSPAPESVSPDMLMYISEIVSAPVLCAIDETLVKPLSSLSWKHGHCPVCGSSPSISHLSPKEVTDLDQLVGGGGKKYLHCSLCGHDWRFKRNACPSCGNDDSETREIFYNEDTQYERVEACHKCGKYCLNIDMRECEPQPHLDTVQIGLIHLDLYALKNNLTPISPTLWNTVE